MKQNFKSNEKLIENSAVRKARRLKLKQAREATGRSPQEIAASAGLPAPTYYDLEEQDGELNMVVSLGELFKLASALGIRTRFIFDDKIEGQLISAEQLCAKIKSYLDATRMSISEFENRVGFVIAPALGNPVEVFNWNVDCLRFVCSEIGVNWLDALP